MTDIPSIPISRIGNAYYIFQAPSIARLRSTYNIPGLLTGTLPQASQQNVFYGLPLRLMPEEARVLVEKGVGFMFDDTLYHQQSIKDLESSTLERKKQWLAALRGVGLGIAQETENKKEAEKSRALSQMTDKAKRKKESRVKDRKPKSYSTRDGAPQQQPTTASTSLAENEDEDDSILSHGGFFLPTSSPPKPRPSPKSQTPPRTINLEPHVFTPTISHPPLRLPSPPLSSEPSLPEVPPSYPLFRHVNDKGYFLSPGLRFGAQYMAYPGDPLRYHSHFMVVGREWDEEVDLLSLVGLGRLGTGVKKGVLIGGEEPKKEGEGVEAQRDVRCFCIEWAGM